MVAARPWGNPSRRRREDFCAVACRGFRPCRLTLRKAGLSAWQRCTHFSHRLVVRGPRREARELLPYRRKAVQWRSAEAPSVPRAPSSPYDERAPVLATLISSGSWTWRPAQFYAKRSKTARNPCARREM